jgi:hypothetical protein
MKTQEIVDSLTLLRQTLTTGQIAHVCDVAPRTASRWIDSGRLPGYLVPGSRARRVRLPDFVEFLVKNNMSGLLQQYIARRCVVIAGVGETFDILASLFLSQGATVLRETEPYRIGLAIQGSRPVAVIIDCRLPSQADSGKIKVESQDQSLSTNHFPLSTDLIRTAESILSAKSVSKVVIYLGSDDPAYCWSSRGAIVFHPCYKLSEVVREVL